MQISSASSAHSLQSASAPQRPPGPRGQGEGGPPSHQEAVATLGASLPSEVQESLLAAIDTMSADGASHEEIKAFVDSALEAEGVSVPEQRPGMLVDRQI